MNDAERLASVESKLRDLTARLNALAEGNLAFVGEGFRIGSTRLLEKLVSDTEHDDEYHLHQRDSEGTESDLTGARSIQGIPVSETAPTTTQIYGYNAATNQWEPTAAGAAAAHEATHRSGGADELSHDNLAGVSADDHHAQSHNVASHSDTTATGTELETLTDGSDADALHNHPSDLTPAEHTAIGAGAPHHAEAHSVASHNDTTATGAELEILTDGSTAGGLHVHVEAEITDLDHLTGAEAITAVEGEATLDLAGDVTIAGTKSLAVDDIREKTATDGVTIDDSEEAGVQGTWIVDNKIYPRKDKTDAYLSVSGTGDLYWVGNITDGDYFFFDESADMWDFKIANASKFQISGLLEKIVSAYNHDFEAGIDVTGNITVTGTVDGVDIATLVTGAGAVTAVATADDYLKNDANDETSGTVTAAGFTTTGIGAIPLVAITAAPANDTASGMTCELQAGEAVDYGEMVYLAADGMVNLTDADAVATSLCMAVCVESGNVANEATGTFLLHGFIEHEFNFATVGAPVFLDTATPGAVTLTAPSGENDCIVIVGIVKAADCLYFNPNFQAIVEHGA